MAPIGIFAIAASAAGTMTLAELGRLQGYFIAYIIAFALLTFLVLPGLVAAVTPFKYREILAASRTALLIAFATGKALVVLPMIIESVKELFETHDVQSDEAVATAEIVVPLAYPFPSLGRMLAMLFVPFAAWFVGDPMGLADYGLYIGAGFPSFFGSVTIAIPFSLELMQLPADMFQLFLVTGVIAANISDCLTAMHIMTLTVLVACAMAGTLRIDWKAVALVVGGTAVLGTSLIGGTRVYLTTVFEGSYNKDEVVANMQLLSDPAGAVIVEPGPNPIPLAIDRSPLVRINERGVIRVGYIPGSLPWAYSNRQGELVGFDIDLAHRLAHDLDVTLEFVPFELDRLTTAMADDHFDIAMSGIVGTVDRSQQMPLSSYLDVNIALVVPDHRRDEFSSLESIRELGAITIGIASQEYVGYTASTLFPNAEFVIVPSPRDFFERTGPGEDVDAWITSAQEGAAWTLLYPAFGVVLPFPRSLAIPLVYPTQPAGDGAMKRFIDHWIGLKQRQGVFDAAYEYWILGQGSEEIRPRWSVIRDVLGWMD
jgi:ABC-type amino acid transport substrate-binding protein